MIHQKHWIGGESVSIFTVESEQDYETVRRYNLYPGLLAYDTESTGLDPYAKDWHLRMFQFGDTVTAFVIPAEHRELIEEVVRTPRRWVAHNAPFDVLSIDQYLGKQTDLLRATVDTYLYAHIDDSRSAHEGGVGHGLKEQCDAYVSPDASIGEQLLKLEFKKLTVPIPGEVYKSGPRKGTQKYRKAKLAEGWRLIPTFNPVYTLYAGLDPILTMRLWHKLRTRVRDRELLKFEHELQRQADVLTRRGFRLDVLYATQLSAVMGWQVEDHQLWADWFGCSDVNSPVKVGEALIRQRAILREKTPTGKPKVDNKVLKKIRETADGDLAQLIDHILEAKRKAKRKASYVDTMLSVRDQRNRVHARINSLRARTARMSISYPPLQQLPAREWEIRRCLVARHGFIIVAADYAQIEMRVAAAFAGETKMIEAAKRGESIHKVVALQVFGEGYTEEQYTFSKNLGFGAVYGGGAATLSRQTEIPYDRAQEIVKLFREQFPQLTAWKRRVTWNVLTAALSSREIRTYQSLRNRMWDYDPNTEEGRQAHAYLRRRMDQICQGKTGVVTTPIGRRLHVDAAKAYTVVNYLVQSASRDILARGMLDVMAVPELARTVLLPVHDELVGEARRDEAEEIVKQYAHHMTTEFMGVPITAEGKVYGKSWGDGYGAPKDAADALFTMGV